MHLKWPSGHTGRPMCVHGRQSSPSTCTIWCGVRNGKKPNAGTVGPNSAITGRPRAAARCISPESLVRISAQESISAASSSSDSLPVTFSMTASGAAARMRLSISVLRSSSSCPDPKRMTARWRSPVRSSAASAKRSAGHILLPCFADGQTPIQEVRSLRPDAIMSALTLSRAEGGIVTSSPSPSSVTPRGSTVSRYRRATLGEPPILG